MILDITQIKTLLNQPADALVAKGTEYNKKLRFHIFGEDKESHIQEITGYEKPVDLALRKKHTTTNKDVFARLGRPIDKVFSARGGSFYLNLSGEAEKRGREVDGNIINRSSVKSWLQANWVPQMLADPFGVIFMEIVTKDMVNEYKATGQSFAYPVYKGITSIHKYLPKGSMFEYIIFCLSDEEKLAEGIDKKEQVFRVVDDAYDYLIKKVGEDISVIEDKTLPNFFGYVPAMRNSDFTDPKLEGGVLSLYDDSIELAEKFLLKNSIKAVHDFKHGFPKYSEFGSDCPECKGTGMKNGEDCEHCKGSGQAPVSKPNQVKLLKLPQAKEDGGVFPRDMFAFLDVPKTYHDIAVADLFDLENAMSVTTWGTQSRVKTQGMSAQQGGDTKTATEIIDDIEPQANRLWPISEMAEKRHKFILDSAIRININTFYTGASVNYGRRYMIEKPDAIWEKYSKARKDGSPQNVLDELLNEYYDAKYQSDPIGLVVAKKLMYVEPFVHLTIQQVKELMPAEDDYKNKLYFSEWLATVNELILVSNEVEKLKQLLSAYSSGKTLNKPEPKQLNPAA